MAKAVNTSTGHLFNIIKGKRHAGLKLAVKLAQLTSTNYGVWTTGGDLKAREFAIENFKPTTQQQG